MMFRRKHELLEATKYEDGWYVGSADRATDGHDGPWYAVRRGERLELRRAADFEAEYEQAPVAAGSHEEEEDYEA